MRATQELLKRLRPAVLIALAALILLGAKPTDEPAFSQFVTGRLLVAVPKMPDGRFRNTIILIIEHNKDGAFGLIINRPLGIAEFEMESKERDIGALPTQKTQVFYGGPVERNKTFIVHSTDYENTETLKIAHGVSMTANLEILHAIATGRGPKQVLHVLGYSGWSPSQLNTEMSRDDWYTAPVTKDLVFSEKQEGKWEKAVAERYRDL